MVADVYPKPWGYTSANWGYVSAVCEQSFRIKGYCLRIYVYFFAIAFSSAYPPNH